MNPIEDKIDAFLKEFDELEKLNQKATKEQGDLDKELSSCYHKIEGTKITHISQSHKLIKELQNVLERRRANKIEGILLRSTCDTLREKVKTLKENKKTLVAKNNQVLSEIKLRATE